MRWVMCLLAAVFMLRSAAAAQTDAPCARGAETECMLETIWGAASVLPAEKQARLTAPMLRLVALGDDAALLKSWEGRLGETLGPEPDYGNYARDAAAGVIAADGWTGFMQKARARTVPFHVGRPEIMGEGVRIADTPERAKDVIDLMFSLARPHETRGGRGDTFEQADFGHILSELAMERCDLAGFDRAVAMTAEPGALRYRIWRARITGASDGVRGAITDGATSDDTRHVRQAIDGYRAILKRGYCSAPPGLENTGEFPELNGPFAR